MIAALRRHLFAPPQVSLVVHGLRGGVLAVVVGMLLLSIILGVAHLLGFEQSLGLDGGPEFAINWIGLLGVVVFAPVVETAVLALMLGALGHARLGVATKAAICGLLWGGLHAIVAPFWFVAPAFGFFVFSCAWLAWRPRGLGKAFMAAMLPHVVNNLLAFSLLVVAERAG